MISRGKPFYVEHSFVSILLPLDHNAGIDGPRKKLLQYEVNLINLQITMEDSFKSFLELDGLDNTAPGVLICDRGALL